MQMEKLFLWPDRQDVYLQSYILEKSLGISKGRKHAAILICPGGSYLGLADREAEPVALRFAAHGYHAFVLHYSTFFSCSTTEIPANPTKEEMDGGNLHALFPGPLLDLAKAMLTIYNNADRWMIDVDQIAVCGFSAGGHLAVSLGTHWQDAFLRDRLMADNHCFRPAALILGYPLTDYLIMKQAVQTFMDMDPSIKPMWHLCCQAVFGNPEPADDQLAMYSPTLHVSRHMPPAFIWHTANDDLVPVANALKMASAMAGQDIPFELHIFEDGAHGLALADETTAADAAQINTPVQAWVPLVQQWLKNRLKPGLHGV